jgi:hypothetical protein
MPSASFVFGGKMYLFKLPNGNIYTTKVVLEKKGETTDFLGYHHQFEDTENIQGMVVVCPNPAWKDEWLERIKENHEDLRDQIIAVKIIGMVS